MKVLSLSTLAMAGLLLTANPALAIHRDGPRYATPPARPSVSSWPKGLAKVIAHKSYLDGFNYQNPGYVTQNVDTLYYAGDMEALNSFLAQLAGVKGLQLTVAFSGGVGKVNRHVRADTGRQQEVYGLPLSDADGQPCAWLVSVTPKDWVRSARDTNVEAEARVLIFLRHDEIHIDALRLPRWNAGER